MDSRSARSVERNSIFSSKKKKGRKDWKYIRRSMKVKLTGDDETMSGNECVRRERETFNNNILVACTENFHLSWRLLRVSYAY